MDKLESNIEKLKEQLREIEVTKLIAENSKLQLRNCKSFLTGLTLGLFLAPLVLTITILFYH